MIPSPVHTSQVTVVKNVKFVNLLFNIFHIEIFNLT